MLLFIMPVGASGDADHLSPPHTYCLALRAVSTVYTFKYKNKLEIMVDSYLKTYVGAGYISLHVRVSICC